MSSTETMLVQQREILSRCINQIDDYFEYRNESAKDKKFVMRCLDKCTLSLQELQAQKNPEA